MINQEGVAPEPSEKNVNSIPCGWKATELGVLVTESLIGLVIPKSMQNATGNGIPYVKMENITPDGFLNLAEVVKVKVNSNDLNRYKLVKGDILVNTRNSYELVGKTAIVSNDDTSRVFNNNIIRVRITKGINPNFIALQMNSPVFKEYIRSQKRATTNICALYGKDLFPSPILLAPLSEQNRLVSKVEELFSFLDAGIASLRVVQAQLKRYRQAVLKHAFDIEITDHGTWVPFDKVVESYQNGFSKRRSDKGEAIKVLRLADIEDGVITSKFPRAIKLTNDEQQKYLLKKSDLLCIRVNGSKNNTGRLVVFDKDEHWAFCDHLIRIRLKNGCLSQYAKHYFDSKTARKYIESSIISSAGQNTISQASLGKIPFPFSLPEEQQVILEKINYNFSIIKHEELIMEQFINQSHSLRQSILKQAFDGKLGSSRSK